MSEAGTFEKTVAGWFKDVPHLSVNSRQWLAENIWWLTLAGVILGGMIVGGVMMLAVFANVALIALGGVYGAILGGVALVAILIILAFAIASLILAGIAVPSLKTGQKRGWNLLFIVTIINTVGLVVDFLLTFDLFRLVWGTIIAGLVTYLLFEIRGYFGQEKRTDKGAKV